MFPQNQNTSEQEPVAHSTDMSANFETELWRAAALHSWFSVEWVISLVRALFVEIRYLCRSHLGKCSISQWRCEWNACRLFSIYILSVYKASGLSLSLVDRNCCHCVVVYFSPLLPPSTPHVLTHSARLLANQFLRCALLQFFFLYLLLKWVGCECIANAVRSKDMAVCGRTAPHSHRDKFSIERLQNDVRQKYSNIFNNNRLFVRFCTWWRPRRHCRKISPHIKRTSAFNCFFFYFGFRLIQKLNDKLLSGAFRLDYFILPVAFPFC